MKLSYKRVCEGSRNRGDAVYIGSPSAFANPYSQDEGYTIDEALALFREYALNRAARDPNWLTPLREKNLSCWCSEGAPCHGDVLLEFVNKTSDEMAEELSRPRTPPPYYLEPLSPDRLEAVATAPLAPLSKRPKLTFTLPQKPNQPHPVSKSTSQLDVSAFARDLANEHHHISVSPDVASGIPHLTGTHLSVGDILAQLYTLGNVAAVLDYYQQDAVSEDQVKEAIAYAQDFIEEACLRQAGPKPSVKEGEKPRYDSKPKHTLGNTPNQGFTDLIIQDI